MAAKSADKRHKDTPIWEWVIAAIGLILVCGAIGLTLYRALQGESTPPILEVTIESVEALPNGHLVTFVITNSGSETAAGVTVEGTISKGDEEVETSTTTLVYAPANSTRRGGLMFSKDPAAYDLKVRAAGFERP